MLLRPRLSPSLCDMLMCDHNPSSGCSRPKVIPTSRQTTSTYGAADDPIYVGEQAANEVTYLPYDVCYLWYLLSLESAIYEVGYVRIPYCKAKKDDS